MQSSTLSTTGIQAKKVSKQRTNSFSQSSLSPTRTIILKSKNKMSSSEMPTLQAMDKISKDRGSNISMLNKNRLVFRIFLISKLWFRTSATLCFKHTVIQWMQLYNYPICIKSNNKIAPIFKIWKMLNVVTQWLIISKRLFLQNRLT